MLRTALDNAHYKAKAIFNIMHSLTDWMQHRLDNPVKQLFDLTSFFYRNFITERDKDWGM